MSSMGGRIKRTKNVRNLDSDDAPSLARSIIEEHPKIIPAGRQLDRTPPSKNERVTTYQPSKPDGSPASQQVVKDEPCGQEITKHISCNGSNEVLQQPKVKDERKSIRRSSSTAASATSGNANPEIFIQGMQGYQWTDTDLDFVYQTKLKKQVQQAQQELIDVQKSLKNTRQMRDMALAKRDKIKTELSKVSSCERIQQISMEILLRSHSSSQLEGLDFKALIAKLKVADVCCTTAEEKTEVSKLKTEVEKAQVMREKEEQLTKDIDSCKENINQFKVNVHSLTAEISALEFKMSRKEETRESAKPRQKVHRSPKPCAAPSAPKPLKTPAAPKPSKTPAAPSAPKPSKPPATLKAQTASKPFKATTGPKAPEADVGGLRRSKRIAAKKEK
ncbi:IgA FC receptor [Ctenopharyngodon idella]|uniref:IgA FC receptor n=1 Tax=Ctenopharyngodon idella TaxID=7959 RepID=UPI00222EC178|nr:IgA FC receptor [Ctenopharyngodon idella]